MNKSLLILIGLMLSAFCVACHSGDEPDIPKSETHRSVLVYMIASNNLVSYSQMDLSEMKKAVEAGSLNGGRLLVYIVNKTDTPTLYEMTETGELELVKEYDSEISSVSMSRMEQVINDFKAMAPANDYGLVLWSHGSGWLVDGIEQPDAVTDSHPVAPASFGQDNGSKMNVSALASVLNGKEFSFIYFDCCYMGSVEVLYELRHCADYIVSSPSELPVYGMDYSLNVPCFFSREADLAKAAKNTYEYYDKQSDPSWRTCTISVVKTSALDDLAKASAAIFAAAPWPAESVYEPQKYMTGTCYHYDFLDYFKDITVDPQLLSNFKEALSAAVICEYSTDYLWKTTGLTEIKINSHCGLSSYVLYNPSQISTRGYNTTSWYRDVVSAMTERK